jgi:hypothetical protein
MSMTCTEHFSTAPWWFVLAMFPGFFPGLPLAIRCWFHWRGWP